MRDQSGFKELLLFRSSLPCNITTSSKILCDQREVRLTIFLVAYGWFFGGFATKPPDLSSTGENLSELGMEDCDIDCLE